MQSGGSLDSPVAGVPLIAVVVVGGLLALVAGALLRIVVVGAGRPNLDQVKSLSSVHLAILLVATWIVASYVLLVTIGLYTFELFLVVSIIGFLVSEFLLSPPQTSDRLWSRFRLLRIPAMLVFVYIMFQRVVTVIQ